MNIESVEDVKIYEIAANVLSSITNDPNTPPNHKIIVSYELARQIYRDIEGYYEFASSALLEEPMVTILNHFNPKRQLLIKKTSHYY